MTSPLALHGTVHKYNHGCRCELCRCARRDYMQDYGERKKRGEPPLRASVMQHGTAQKYNLGCRCDPCRVAKLDANRKFRRSKRAAIAAGTAEVKEHGMRGYRNGCRCDICREAINAHNRARRKKSGPRGPVGRTQAPVSPAAQDLLTSMEGQLRTMREARDPGLSAELLRLDKAGVPRWALAAALGVTTAAIAYRVNHPEPASRPERRTKAPSPQVTYVDAADRPRRKRGTLSDEASARIRAMHATGHRDLDSELLRLNERGVPQDVLAAALGVAGATVSKRIVRAKSGHRPAWTVPARSVPVPPSAAARLRELHAAKDPRLGGEITTLHQSGHQKQDIAEALAVTPTGLNYLIANAAAPRSPRQHQGEVSYNSNCKCEHCKQGKAAYWQARAAAIQQGHAEVANHGVGGYRQGCRCDVCREAMRVRVAELRQRKRAA